MGDRCLIRTAIWLFIALALVWAGRARAEQPPSLAVFQIEPRGAEMTEKELEALSSYLVSTASQALGARPIAWQTVLDFLRTKDLYFCLDRRCQIEAEQAVRADYSLVVVINKMGKSCVFSATLYPSGSPASRSTAMHRGPCTVKAYPGAIDQLVASLARPGRLPPRQATGQRPLVAVGPPRPVQPPQATTPAARPAPPQLVQRPTPPRPVERPAPGPPVGPAPAVVPEPDPQDLPAEPPAPQRDIDRYGRYLLTGSVLYAPAPMILHERFEGQATKKVPDRYGPLLSFDYRLADYLLLGAQLGLLLAEGADQLESTVHFGALWPLTGSTALVGRVGTGVFHLKIDAGVLQGKYTGAHGWLGIGLRQSFGDLVGLEVQLSGTAGRGLGEFQDLTVLRLQLQLGVLFGFGR